MEMMDYMPYPSYSHPGEHYSTFVSYEEEKRMQEKQKQKVESLPLTLKEKIKNKL